MNTRINRNSFGDYTTNLDKLSEENKDKQERKIEVFIEEAIAGLDKHYLRWCNELLPAALGGEAPLAKTVPRILLNNPLPIIATKTTTI
jgi:hypothetical protein